MKGNKTIFLDGDWSIIESRIGDLLWRHTLVRSGVEVASFPSYKEARRAAADGLSGVGLPLSNAVAVYDYVGGATKGDDQDGGEGGAGALAKM